MQATLLKAVRVSEISLVAFLACAAPATMAADTVASASSSVNTNGTFPPPTTDFDSAASATGAPLTVGSSLSKMFEINSDVVRGTAGAGASATVQIGSIGMFSSANATATNRNPAVSYLTTIGVASASARWFDAFTLNGGILNGQIGHLNAGFSVEGGFDSIFDNSVAFAAEVDEYFHFFIRLAAPVVGGDNSIGGGQQHIVDYRGERTIGPPVGPPNDLPILTPGVYTIGIDFEWGTPIQVDVRGDVGASVTAFATAALFPTSEVSANANFAHTLRWNGITSVTDSSGNPITNYTASSGSGFDFRTAAVLPPTVPVPPALPLLVSGLAGVFMCRRRPVE